MLLLLYFRFRFVSIKTYPPIPFRYRRSRKRSRRQLQHGHQLRGLQPTPESISPFRSRRVRYLGQFIIPRRREIRKYFFSPSWIYPDTEANSNLQSAGRWQKGTIEHPIAPWALLFLPLPTFWSPKIRQLLIFLEIVRFSGFRGSRIVQHAVWFLALNKEHLVFRSLSHETPQILCLSEFIIVFAYRLAMRNMLPFLAAARNKNSNALCPSTTKC